MTGNYLKIARVMMNQCEHREHILAPCCGCVYREECTDILGGYMPIEMDVFDLGRKIRDWKENKDGK